MSNGIVMRRLLLALCLVPLAALAEEAVQTLGLDCWISAEQDNFAQEYIRCIEDRGNLTLDGSQILSGKDAALDQIHQGLHDEHTTVATLDLLVKTNFEVLKEGGYWKIRIFSYPYPSSWDEGRPQMLVQAVLCPEGFYCPVFIRHD